MRAQEAAVRIWGVLNNNLPAVIQYFHVKPLTSDFFRNYACYCYAFEYKATGLRRLICGCAIDQEHWNLYHAGEAIPELHLLLPDS